jgi:hypothetical protein
MNLRNVSVIVFLAIFYISCKEQVNKKNNTIEKNEAAQHRTQYAAASIGMNDSLSTIYSYDAYEDDQNIYFYFQKKAENNDSDLKTLDSLIISKKEFAHGHKFSVAGQYKKNNQVFYDLPAIFEPERQDTGQFHKKIIKAWYYDFDREKIRSVSLPDTAFRCFKVEEREPVDTSDAAMFMSESSETFKLEGDWGPDCKYSNIGIEIYMAVIRFHFRFTINTITVKSKTENNLYYLKFSPPPISPFPEEMDWKHFSEDSTIAVIKLLSDNQATFSWFGFYNKKRKKREFTDYKLNASDGDYPVLLERCY